MGWEGRREGRGGEILGVEGEWDREGKGGRSLFVKIGVKIGVWALFRRRYRRVEG